MKHPERLPFKMFTVQDVAKKFNVCNETVRRWIRSGKLRAKKESDRKGYRITLMALTELEAYRLGLIDKFNE